jgi:hypothetical protein
VRLCVHRSRPVCTRRSHPEGVDCGPGADVDRDAVQAGIRAMVESRRTDEPKRLMRAFIDGQAAPK